MENTTEKCVGETRGEKKTSSNRLGKKGKVLANLKLKKSIHETRRAKT